MYTVKEQSANGTVEEGSGSGNSSGNSTSGGGGSSGAAGRSSHAVALTSIVGLSMAFVFGMSL